MQGPDTVRTIDTEALKDHEEMEDAWVQINQFFEFFVSFCANFFSCQAALGIGNLKSHGESRLGNDYVLKNSLPEGRCLIFANFVSFCADLLRPSVNLLVTVGRPSIAPYCPIT